MTRRIMRWRSVSAIVVVVGSAALVGCTESEVPESGAASPSISAQASSSSSQVDEVQTIFVRYSVEAEGGAVGEISIEYLRRGGSTVTDLAQVPWEHELQIDDGDEVYLRAESRDEDVMPTCSVLMGFDTKSIRPQPGPEGSDVVWVCEFGPRRLNLR